MKFGLSVAHAPRMFVRSVRLLAAVAALALATTGECSPVVLAGYLLFFLIGMRVESFPRLEAILGAAQPFFALLVFTLAVADFFTVSQSFLLAVAHFLLGLQALRLTALRTNRENLGSVLVSSLMVLSASTLAVDWTFFVMLALYLPALVWTLMLHTIALESDLSSGGEPARALSGSSPVWHEMAPSLRRAAAAAFAIAAGCCAVVFIAFPRFNFQGFRGQFLQPLHKTGFTSQVDLEKSGRIYEDPSIIMRVEVPETDRSRWTGYLRGSVLEEFDGRLWRRASRDSSRVYPTGLGEFRLRAAGLGPWIRQSIYLESLDTPVLFAVAHPFFVRIERPYLEMTADGTLQRRQSDAWRIHYDVVSAPTAGTEPFLSGRFQQLRDRYGADTSHAESVPPSDGGRVEALAREIGGVGSPQEVAERLAGHLRANYAYTLDPAAPDGSAPVERFLFSSRRGHCEYFASALAVMLRHRGIPARIVTGFLSREWNDRGRYFIVRMRHAHAWVEYFDPRRGWVEIDPSPRVVDEGEFAGGYVRQAREIWDFMNLRWNRYILSYDLERQVAIIRSFSANSSRLSLRVEGAAALVRRFFSIDGISWKPRLPGAADLRIPIGPIAAGAAALSMIWLAMARRRRAARVWFYPPLLKALVRAGARPAPGRTLKELVGEAAPALGDRAEPARRLAEAYYRFRFDSGARESSEDRTRLRAELRALRRGRA